MEPVYFVTPEEYARMADQAQMSAEVLEHEIMEFLHGLSAEHLRVLNHIIHRSGDPAHAGHMTGLIRAIMHFKHGMCKCGNKHEQVDDLLPTKPMEPGTPEFEAEVQRRQDDRSGMQTVTDHSFTMGPGALAAVCTAMVGGEDGFGKHCGLPPEAHVFSTSLDPVEQDSYTAAAGKVMSKYNVAPMHGEFPKVVCTGCGMSYPNLRDRMLKGPDDCHGCHIKAAQG